MPIPSGVDKKKSKVYIQKTGGEYLQILPESFCEGEILADSMWPVSSHALKLYSNSIEERIAPFSGATSTTVGKIGTVPQAEVGDRNSFLRGDGTWTRVNITDDKVKSIYAREKKFYLVGTEVADTNTGQLDFDPDVFVTANHGELQANSFIGNLTGDVVGNLEGMAQRAERDSEGNMIVEHYATIEDVQETYAPLEHVHPSSEITALTGYVKGTATAISDDDTLNQALGKLEKRVDNAATSESPTLTGVPTTPTPTSNSVSTQIANKEYVDDKISDLINGAGSALDTLKEIENALGNDPDFAGTMTAKLATKLDKTSANYVKTLSISDNTAGSGQILKVQRGDDSSYTLTIKDTIIQPSDEEPKAPNESPSAGSSVKYSRADHIHPLQTSISGNAATATSAEKADKLTTPRKLRANLTATADATFDGSADQLNIPITGVLKVANGGTGAANLDGLVQTGNVNQTIGGTKTFSNTISGSINGNAATATTASKVQGTVGTSWVVGTQAGNALVNATNTGYGAIFNAPTKDYRVALGTYPSNDNLVYLYSVTNANVNAGTNTKAKQVTWNADTGELSATSFTGTLNGASTSCTGNAASATNDSAGQKISTTYIKALSVSGRTITYTKGDNSKGTITTQDTVYTHPTTAGNKHIPAGGSSGQILRWSAAGTAAWGADSSTTYSAATQSAAGLMSAADKTKLDGIASGATKNTSNATQSAAGLMSAADKKKLDGMTAGKVGTSTVGSTSKPIYLNGGTPTAITATVGSATKPVYLNSGTITACSSVSAAWLIKYSSSTNLNVSSNSWKTYTPSSNGVIRIWKGTGDGWQDGYIKLTNSSGKEIIHINHMNQFNNGLCAMYLPVQSGVTYAFYTSNSNTFKFYFHALI